MAPPQTEKTYFKLQRGLMAVPDNGLAWLFTGYHLHTGTCQEVQAACDDFRQRTAAGEVDEAKLEQAIEEEGERLGAGEAA
jgi:hypothetical protein